MEPNVLADAYAIAARHRVPAAEVRPLPAGEANHVLALGDRLVLRIPRSPGFAADLRKEAALIPAARDAGVRTPALVAFADPPGGNPAMVLERAPGTDLTGRDPAPGTLNRIGAELARIHRAEPPERAGVPRDTAAADPAPLLELLRERGHVDADAVRWLGRWCGLLADRVPAAAEPALVHGDIAPQNLVVTGDGVLGGIVDWGDAAVADPATDFAKLPPWWLPHVLAGYRRERGADTRHPWEARALRHHLLWALGRLADTEPRPGRRHWTAPPASRILGLLRLFASDPPAPWPGLAPRP